MVAPAPDHPTLGENNTRDEGISKLAVLALAAIVVIVLGGGS